MNTETKQFEGHTPGPLKIAQNGLSVTTADRQRVVCHAKSNVDARLFASAPELLKERDVCREALNFIVNDFEPGYDAQLTAKGYNMACAALNGNAVPVATINAELLEALKVAKEELTFLHVQDTNGKHWSKHSETAIFKINSTIAKAEGRATV